METLDDNGRRRQIKGLINILFWSLMVMFPLGIFSELNVRSTLINWDDPARTLMAISNASGLFDAAIFSFIVIVVLDVFIAVSFYKLFGSSNETTLLMLCFRLIYVAIKGFAMVGLVLARDVFASGNMGNAIQLHDHALEGMRFLKMHHYGFSVALLFFGLHLILLAKLFSEHRMIPRFLVWLLMVAGVGYGVNSLATIFAGDFRQLQTLVIVVFIIPMTFSELSLGVWLKFRRL